MESGAPMLQSAFDQVERRDITGTLFIPEVAPALAYVASTRSIAGKMLPDGVSWDALMAELDRSLTATIAARGAFRVTTHAGVFVCS